MPPHIHRNRQWRCVNCQFVNYGTEYDTCVQCQARFGNSSFLDDSSSHRGTALSTSVVHASPPLSIPAISLLPSSALPPPPPNKQQSKFYASGAQISSDGNNKQVNASSSSSSFSSSTPSLSPTNNNKSLFYSTVPAVKDEVSPCSSSPTHQKQQSSSPSHRQRSSTATTTATTTVTTPTAAKPAQESVWYAPSPKKGNSQSSLETSTDESGGEKNQNSDTNHNDPQVFTSNESVYYSPSPRENDKQSKSVENISSGSSSSSSSANDKNDNNNRNSGPISSLLTPSTLSEDVFYAPSPRQSTHSHLCASSSSSSIAAPPVSSSSSLTSTTSFASAASSASSITTSTTTTNSHHPNQEVSFYSSAPLPITTSPHNNNDNSSGGNSKEVSLSAACSATYPGDISLPTSSSVPSASSSSSLPTEPQDSAFYSSIPLISEHSLTKNNTTKPSHNRVVSLAPWECAACQYSNSALRDTCLQCNEGRPEPEHNNNSNNTVTNRKGSTASVASNASEFSPAQGRLRETGSPPRVPLLPSQCECGNVFASPLVLRCEKCSKPRSPSSPEMTVKEVARRSSASPRRSSLSHILPDNARIYERRSSLPELSSTSSFSSTSSSSSTSTVSSSLSEKDKKNLRKEEERRKKELEKEEERKKKEQEKEEEKKKKEQEKEEERKEKEEERKRQEQEKEQERLEKEKQKEEQRLEKERQKEEDRKKEEQRKIEKQKRKEEERLEKEKKEKEDIVPSKKFSEGYLRGLSVCGTHKCACLGFKPQIWSSKKCAECEHWNWKHDAGRPPSSSTATTTRTLSGLSHNDVLRITWCEKESEQQQQIVYSGEDLFAAFESANQLVSLLTEVEEMNEQNEKSELMRMSSESTNVGTLSRHVSAASLDETPLSITLQNQHSAAIPIGIPVQVPFSNPVVMGIPISVPMAVAVAAPPSGTNITMGIPITSSEYNQQQHGYYVSSSNKDDDHSVSKSAGSAHSFQLSSSMTSIHSQDNQSGRGSSLDGGGGPFRLTASVDSLALPSTPTRTSLSSAELTDHTSTSNTPDRSPKTSLKSAISRLFAKKKDSVTNTSGSRDSSAHGTTNNNRNEARNSISETRLDNDNPTSNNVNNNNNYSGTKEDHRTNITLTFVDAGSSSSDTPIATSPTPSLSPGSSCMFSQFISAPSSSSASSPSGSSLAVPLRSNVSLRKTDEIKTTEIQDVDSEDEGDDYEGDTSEDEEQDQGGLFSKTPMSPHVAASLKNLYLSTRSPAFPNKLLPKPVSPVSPAPPDLSNIPVSMPPALAAHFRRSSAGSAPNSPPPSSPNSPTSSPTKIQPLSTPNLPLSNSTSHVNSATPPSHQITTPFISTTSVSPAPSPPSSAREESSSFNYSMKPAMAAHYRRSSQNSLDSVPASSQTTASTAASTITSSTTSTKSSSNFEEY